MKVRKTFLSGMFLAGLLPAVCVAQQTVTLSGRVLGASGKHPVYVALWDAKSFLGQPVLRVRLEAQGSTAFAFKVRPGSWAMSAFEDVNGNGKLDMGLMGPKEPSGFWRPFHQWHKPRFADVASQVEEDTPGADIQIH